VGLVEALFPLGSAGYLAAFEPAQLHAMAAMSIKAQVVGFGIALFFFGPFFLVAGYLIFRSTYFPKAIGFLYQIAGVAYLANGLVLVLAPRFAGPAFIAMAIPVFVGEVSFCLWLLFRGVDAEKWKARTGTDASVWGSTSPSAA
jgi:hydrogenase-4 membrane subunit HyfE